MRVHGVVGKNPANVAHWCDGNSLSSNYLQNDHAISLAEVLPKVPQLRRLQLAGNNIHARGVLALANAIAHHEQLLALK